MNDELYLVISYFAIGAMCAGLAFIAFSLVRSSFVALTATTLGDRLGRLLKRLLFAGILLPSMAGFFSVTFISCSSKYQSYQEVIADRSYLVAKNEEQLGTSLGYISKALLAWAAIATVCIVAAKRGVRPDARTGR